MFQHLRSGIRWGAVVRPWVVMVTLLLIVLALGAMHQPARAEEDGDTIPPGGTIPPAPIDLLHGFVRVFHAAPFAENVVDSEVDVCNNATNTPITGLTDLYYLTDSGYQPFLPGDYDWYIGTPGCDNVVVDIPPFTLYRDAALSIYFLGDGDREALTTILSVDRRGLDQFILLPLMFSQVETTTTVRQRAQ
jgi:hypothetical protein